MANALATIAIYRINSSVTFEATNRQYPYIFPGFPTAGVFVEPVLTPNNIVNGAFIYSRIKTTATGTNEYWSSQTVATIVSALG